jgi:hypothetical protein
MSTNFRDLSPTERELLQLWRTRARTNQLKHYDEEERLMRLHKWLGLPSILLSLAAATLSLFLLKTIGEDLYRGLFAFLSFLAGSLTALQTYYRHSEAAEKHKKAAIMYGFVVRQIERNLASPLLPTETAEALLSQIENKLNDAAQIAPTIQRKRWRDAPEKLTSSEEAALSRR